MNDDTGTKVQEVTHESTHQSGEGFPVVGIGASAGGLEALEQFFREMPETTGMAFLVVQHLSPDFDSVMDELLGRVTKIPIRVMRDGMRIEPNVIYLLGQQHEVVCADGRLLLSERRGGREFNYPIDSFFRSLATDLGSRAVAVILSGTGTDGSRGICEVHNAGGFTLVQSEESCKFDGMPRAALSMGIVDVCVPATDMHLILGEYSQHNASNQRGQLLSKEARDVMQGPMHTIFHLLKQHCGVDFSDYKTTTIGRRIQRRVLLSGLPNLEAYLSVLKQNASEVDRLYKDLLIGVTTFFRDQEVFDALEQDVLPELIERISPDEEFRAWVVGTATGEEAYSLAILISEHMRRTGTTRAVKIFATDVHKDSLSLASRGVYSELSVANIPPEIREQYFVHKVDGYHVAPALRKMVVFVAQNVVRDAPFTRLDLITCRNVMIYLTPHSQKKVLSLFHFALSRHAVLCLGPTETLGELADEFKPINERCRIFRKERGTMLPAAMRLSVAAPSTTPVRPAPSPNLKRAVAARELLETYDVLLDEFMPPSLLVNRHREILHVFPGVSDFLQIREGRPANDVIDMVLPELRMTVSAALRRAQRQKSTIQYSGVRCRQHGEEVDLNLLVRPLAEKGGSGENWLIIFDVQSKQPTEDISKVEFDARAVSRDEVEVLERELHQVRDSLQSTIEQLQETNQELQAANEQLVASNEELQSTNEELHSVNEELYTVNSEHQRKIDELTELTDDMDNLLNTTNVHTVFLDIDLCIRRFTPGIASTFNLIPQDVGRRIDTFTYNLLDSDLVYEVKHVLETETPFEREVRDRIDNCYLMRILPYISGGRVDGVVLTLIEITSLKQAERRLAEVSEIVQHSHDAIMRLSADGHITTWNRGAEHLFGLPASEVIGRSVEILVPPEHRQLHAEILRKTIQGETVDHFQARALCRDGRQIDVSLTLSPIRDEQGAIVSVSEIIRDITAQKKAEEEVRAAVRHRDQFLAMLSHELRNPMAAVVCSTNLQKSTPDLPEVVRDAHGVIEGNIRHMGQMLDDILDLSRFTHDKIIINPQVCDLVKVSAKIIASVRHHFDDKSQQLVLNLPEEPVLVKCDVSRMRQALVNLLVNAAKFTPTGGTIEYALGTEGDQAIATVRDNGIGIVPDLLARIFEPFVQAEQPLDRAQAGMGLGLPLVRMIVEAHGGTVAVRSEGKALGAEFTVNIPLTQEPVKVRDQQRDIDITDKKMVIVEDNPGIRTMLARSMELKGFVVATAADGNAGLEAVLENVPDVALIDVGLPDVNGYELARMIRARADFESTLLVALTGYGLSTDRDKALAAGFDIHLIKPLDPDEVVAAIIPRLTEHDASETEPSKPRSTGPKESDTRVVAS